MYAARLERPTPYVDKTVYVGWNSMCVSAYLEAAKVLGLEPARHFALRSLDRVLAEAWKLDNGRRNSCMWSLIPIRTPSIERFPVCSMIMLHCAGLPRCL